MRSCFSTLLLIVSLVVPAAHAGDLFWSAVPGVTNVRDMAVCGTTVYAATENGLYRSGDLPAEWTPVLGGYVQFVACDGDTVLALQSAIPDVPWVSHDRGDNWAVIQNIYDNGYDIRGFAISGSLALAAVRNGVLRSDDSGDSFSVFAVLWDSSNAYNILDVWTDGSQCVAAGDGFPSGLWYSPSCEADTFTNVVSGGWAWLSASGETIVAGTRYGGYSTDGRISDDGGATWSFLPGSWSGFTGRYNVPFLLAGRILGSRADSVWDGSNFVDVFEGPYLYDMANAQQFGNDLGAGGFPKDTQIRAMAAVDGAQPLLFAGVDGGPLYWFRLPDGWPTEPIDLTPPGPGTISCSPQVATTSSPPATVSLGMSSSGATQVDVVEQLINVNASVVWTGLSYDWAWYYSDSVLAESGWVPFASPRNQSPGLQAGAHLFHAWFADDAGNFTNPSVFSALNLLPGSLSLAEDHGWATIMWLEAGQSVTVGVTAASGDADIYHWEPSTTGFADDEASTWSNDTLTFPARTTGAHLLLIFNYPGSGTLTAGTISAGSTKGFMVTTPAGGRGDGSNPPQTDGPPADLGGVRDWLPASDRSADVNGDGQLDRMDIETLLTFIWSGNPATTGDCTGDTLVDSADLSCVASSIALR